MPIPLIVNTCSGHCEHPFRSIVNTHRSVATLGFNTVALLPLSVNGNWVLDRAVQAVVHEHLGQSEEVRTGSEVAGCRRSDDLV